jgi:hypothetical protein
MQTWPAKGKLVKLAKACFPQPRAEQPFGRDNDSHSGDPGCRPDQEARVYRHFGSRDGECCTGVLPGAADRGCGGFILAGFRTAAERRCPSHSCGTSPISSPGGPAGPRQNPATGPAAAAPRCSAGHSTDTPPYPARPAEIQADLGRCDGQPEHVPRRASAAGCAIPERRVCSRWRLPRPAVTVSR